MIARRILHGLADVATSDEWVEAMLTEDDHFGATDRLRIRLAVHELVVNIIEHAYGGAAGRIEMVVEPHRDRLQFVVIDDGRAFSGATNRPLPDEPSGGGYGLPIIDTVFDDVSYTRVDRTNTWLLSIARGITQETQR